MVYIVDNILITISVGNYALLKSKYCFVVRSKINNQFNYNKFLNNQFVNYITYYKGVYNFLKDEEEFNFFSKTLAINVAQQYFWLLDFQKNLGVPKLEIIYLCLSWKMSNLMFYPYFYFNVLIWKRNIKYYSLWQMSISHFCTMLISFLFLILGVLRIICILVILRCHLLLASTILGGACFSWLWG